MKTYEFILFDLDGTLTDPQEGIVNSIQYALKRYGIEKENHELIRFIGPPLHTSFREFFDTDVQAFEAVDVYREYYSDKGIFENILFEGIPELLQTLQQKGKTICLATSKPQFFAEQILDHFKISHFFKVIVGANLDGTRTEKREVIAEVINQLPGFDPAKAVMIGDRKHDIIGAKFHNMDTIAVLFGYGTLAELEHEQPTYVVKTVGELGGLLK
ncbi:MAG: putative phosphatase [Bacteroidetes bacterium]|nr:putative phosphatase [Bacteroidota bacterium]